MNVKFLDLQTINQSLGKQLTDAADGVIRSGWYLRSSQTEAFEAEWGTYCNAEYAVGVGSGLDALRLVLMGWKIMYGWKDGDEVIVPANTFIATALAVSQAGLKPVFCDVNQEDALICTDEDYLKSILTPNTRCIIPVHLYGHVANLKKLYEFAENQGLKILEDACQSHGAKSDYKKIRTCSYSFYPGKNLGALGDGGCVTTDDTELATLVRNLANYGQTVKYLHDYQGLNSRLDEIQAAILRVKLRRLDADNHRRIEIAEHYYNEFSSDFANSNVNQLKFASDGSHVYHIFPYICENRNEMQRILKEIGIETQIHYPVPCHKQKAYNSYNDFVLKNSEFLAEHELSLPISPVMTDEAVEYVINGVKNGVCKRS